MRLSLGDGSVRLVGSLAILAGVTFVSVSAGADDLATIPLTIKDHRFTPSVIHVPAGKAVIISIKNEDAASEEFDSTALKVEKVVAGGSDGTVRIRPLGAGKYPFMGEYHSDTAQGVVIAE